MKHLIVCLLLCLGLTTKTQTIVQLPEYYDGYGVLIPATVHFNMKFDNFHTLYTPTIEEAHSCEQLIDSLIKAKKLNLHISKDFNLRAWYRQYIGIKKLNDSSKYVFVNFMNFSDSLLAEEWFGSWRSAIVSGSGEFYEINCRIILINLSALTIAKDW